MYKFIFPRKREVYEKALQFQRKYAIIIAIQKGRK